MTQDDKPCSSDAIILTTPRKSAGHNCLYHGSILRHENGAGLAKKGQGVVERYLEEGPGDHSALFIRDDTKQLSISKNCHCGRSSGKSNEHL
jgi:hypothetical protein